ncbi:hypothetical protein BH11MYX3_BH11MYX3_39110 [soil metagenome]
MSLMRTRRLYATVIVFAAACAAAGNNGGNGGGDDQHPIDASPGTDGDVPGDGPQPIDGPPIDAAPIAVTLTQNTGATVGSNNSIACGNNSDGTTSENSWYRVWKLSDEGIVGAFHVTAVTFGVQESTGLPNVQVKIGSYSGNITPPPAQLDTGLITPIAAATFAVPNTASTSTTSVTVPVSANVPALGQMIVEVFSPDALGTGKYFYLGGNSLGESKPGYLRAPTCTTPQPKTTAALGFPTSNLLITVSGTK